MTNRVQHRGFTFREMLVGVRNRCRKAQHLPLQLRRIHLCQQRPHQSISNMGKYGATIKTLHQQVLAKRLDNARQILRTQAEMPHAIELFQRFQLRAAYVTVRDEDECKDSRGGLRAVVGVRAHGGVLQ